MGVAVSEKATAVLRQMGLTGYETRAYLVLLEKGVMTASKISRDGGVPYSKIYEALNSLVRKGWVRAETGRPRRYYPKSPSEALGATELRMEDMISEWKRIVTNELQPLYQQRELREKPDMWILRGEYSISAKLREMLEATRKELMVAAPLSAKELMYGGLPLLKHLADSGVNVQVLITKDWGMEKLVGIKTVKVREHMFGGGIITDCKEALLVLGEDEAALVIWSNHMGLVRFARDYFQYLWETARDIS